MIFRIFWQSNSESTTIENERRTQVERDQLENKRSTKYKMFLTAKKIPNFSIDANR